MVERVHILLVHESSSHTLFTEGGGSKLGAG
jgi:hypothetical protein